MTARHARERAVTVEMIARDRPRILFAHAYAMQVNDGELVSLSGQISVSLPSLEVAKTTRDALSAFIAFEEGARRRRLPEGQCSFCDANPNEGPSHTPSARCESGKHPHCTCDTCF